MPGQLDDISEAIGQLRATVSANEQTVRSMMTQWARQEANASSGRRRLYEKVEGLDRRVGGLEDKVSRMAPIVRAGEVAHLRSAGVRSLLRLLWMSAVALAGAIFQAATNTIPHR